MRPQDDADSDSDSVGTEDSEAEAIREETKRRFGEKARGLDPGPGAVAWGVLSFFFSSFFGWGGDTTAFLLFFAFFFFGEGRGGGCGRKEGGGGLKNGVGGSCLEWVLVEPFCFFFFPLSSFFSSDEILLPRGGAEPRGLEELDLHGQRRGEHQGPRPRGGGLPRRRLRGTRWAVGEKNKTARVKGAKSAEGGETEPPTNLEKWKEGHKPKTARGQGAT